MARPRSNIFSAFKGDLSKLGMDPARESSLLSELNRLNETVQVLQGQGSEPQLNRTIIVQQVASNSPALATSTFDLTLNQTTYFQPGQLVHYIGSTLVEADATANRPANWVVKSNNGATLVLSKLLIEGYILETGGTPDGDTLYTGINGGVTRRKADLVDAEGDLAATVDFLQVVGVVHGLTSLAPRTSYVVGHVNLMSEVG